MKHYGTRSTNANKHPGDVLKPAERKKRRTRAELDLAEQEQVAAKQATLERKAELLRELAKLETESVSVESERLKPSVPKSGNISCHRWIGVISNTHC